MDNIVSKSAELANMVYSLGESGEDNSNLLNLFYQFQDALSRKMSSASNKVQQSVEIQQNSNLAQIAEIDKHSDATEQTTMQIKVEPIENCPSEETSEEAMKLSSAAIEPNADRFETADCSLQVALPKKLKLSIPRSRTVLISQRKRLPRKSSMPVKRYDPWANIELTEFTKKENVKVGDIEDGKDLACKICEVVNRKSLNCSTADKDKNLGNKDLKESNNFEDGNGDVRYDNLVLLLAHVKKVHIVYDENSLQADGYSFKDGEAYHSNGEKLLSKAVMKYMMLICPHCKSQLKVGTGTSMKYGYKRLLFHMHTKHEEWLPSNFVWDMCDKCDYKTYSPKLLKDHCLYCHTPAIKNKKTDCTLCGKNVAVHYMKKHMYKTHKIGDPPKELKQPEPAHCNICDQVLHSASSLLKHKKRKHDKIRDYLCHLCSLQFFEKKELDIHLYSKHQITSNHSVISCPKDGCSFTTICKELLTKHSKVHLESRDFVCAQCGKEFKTEAVLRQHESIMHVTEKKFKCPHCPFVSHVKVYLQRHVNIHSDTKRYQCKHSSCTYASHFQENLKKHVRNVHEKAGKSNVTKPRKLKKAVNKDAMQYSLSQGQAVNPGQPVTTCKNIHSSNQEFAMSSNPPNQEKVFQGYSAEVQQLMSQDYMSL